MARQIIKQPNGLYAEFNRGKDSLVAVNHTRESYIEMVIKREAKRIEKDFNILFDVLERGEPISIDPISFKDALKRTKKSNPEKFKKIKKILTS